MLGLQNNMRRFLKILKSVSPTISFVFIISAIYSILYQIVFLQIKEIFPYANEFGIIAFNLSLALIASTIFYFIVIHLNEYDNKRKAISIVSNKVQRLINIEKRITEEISKKSQAQLSREDYSKEIFEKLLSNITAEDIAPSLFFADKKEINWLEFLFYFVNDTQIIIKEIYQFMPYSELDLLIILDEIENCKYVEFFKIFQKATFTYPNLSVIGGFYLSYTKLISKLIAYLINANKIYR